MVKTLEEQNKQTSRFRQMVRSGIVVALLLMGGLMWFTNRYFTSQFTESARIDAAVRSTLYAGNISAALERQSVVPLILARDQTLIQALQSKDYSATSQRLISYLDEIEAASFTLLDGEGLTVAATDRRLIGTVQSDRDYFNEALRQSGTAFALIPLPEEYPGFYFARKIAKGSDILGVIIVQADLQKLEERWRRSNRQVFVADSEDNVVLSSNPVWKNAKIQDFISDNSQTVPGSRRLNFGFTARNQAFTYVDGTALLRVETKIGFQGWKLSYFETLEGIRARVNGILALEIMVFAILTAFAFFLLSRTSSKYSMRLKQESDDLRALNMRLQAEITERKRAQKNLEVAEQSLQQQSKLAALGTMSAAVSHELNQPLAAMRTYLAGSRLLLQRKRHEEAESSFQRVEDLLDRMGALTRQLKSFARKGEDDLRPIDLRESVKAAFSLMSPQLGSRTIKVTRDIPNTPAVVMGDALRVEQIIVNLLRNALDAMKGVDDPSLEILLTVGDTVTLSVKDSGHGIKDPEQLFEPFYTTKKPGEGIGLGLAISAGIANDLGGGLTARNSERGGAVFELQLPRIEEAALAAQ